MLIIAEERSQDSKLAGRKLDLSEKRTLESLSQLHRAIDSSYSNLSWPIEIKQITLITSAVGGNGDIAAAAKVINLIQKMEPSILFDWIIDNYDEDPKQFLNCLDPTKVNIIDLEKDNPKKIPNYSNFLIVGPVFLGQLSNIYCLRKTLKNLNGPRFDFVENAHRANNSSQINEARMEARKTFINVEDHYKKIHKILFGLQDKSNPLVMGLKKGTGILLDPKRYNAPLSLEYCCPSYLLKLEDKDLKKDILTFEKDVIALLKNSFDL